MKCCIKKLVSLSVPQLLGWKELPTETALVSAYFKLFGQELAYININKEVLQQAVKVLGPPAFLAILDSVTPPHPNLLCVCVCVFLQSVLEPADGSAVLKKVAGQLRGGVAGQWTQPVWLGELRYIVPTCTGLPLEYSSYSTALARAAVSGEMGAQTSALRALSRA